LIKFEYEKSENVISANFLSTNSRSFGDLSQDFESDGSEYAVKLPFECYSFSQLSGNLIEYRKGLIDRIGVERLEHLDSIAKIEKKYTIEELKEIIKKYREKIAEIKNN